MLHTEFSETLATNFERWIRIEHMCSWENLGNNSVGNRLRIVDSETY